MAEAEVPPPAHPHKAHADRPIVWLTSFPKSGNTWTRILLANFLREPARQDGGEEERDRIALIGTISSDRPSFDESAGLPSSDLTRDEIDLLRPAAYRRLAQDARANPIFVKTHDAFQRNLAGADIFPADCTRGAILLVRHPMDVALSFAHHIGHGDPARVVGSLGDPDHIMAGQGKRQLHQKTMGWSGHYLSWTRQEAIPVLVVRYEDILADTSGQFTRMLRFLQIAGADDAGRVSRAVELSRFDRLQSIEGRTGFSEIQVRAERFFRSGRAGEGIEQLPADLQQRISREHGSVMEELGYSQHGTDLL